MHSVPPFLPSSLRSILLLRLLNWFFLSEQFGLSEAAAAAAKGQEGEGSEGEEEEEAVCLSCVPPPPPR